MKANMSIPEQSISGFGQPDVSPTPAGTSGCDSDDGSHVDLYGLMDLIIPKDQVGIFNAY